VISKGVSREAVELVCGAPMGIRDPNGFLIEIME
jgi:hypothetical protein